jgi:hypothetical protein
MTSSERREVFALNEADRFLFLKILGLTGLEFRFTEKAGTHWIRHWRVGIESIEPIFPDSQLDSAVDSAPHIQRTHPTFQLAEEPVYPKESLWDVLTPFPFCLCGSTPSAEASGHLTCSDAVFWQAAEALRSAVASLEQQLYCAEVSHLVLTNAKGDCLTLFFHAVRKRFISHGKLDSQSLADASAIAPASSYQKIEILFSSADSLLEQMANAVAGLQNATPQRAKPFVSTLPGAVVSEFSL